MTTATAPPDQTRTGEAPANIVVDEKGAFRAASPLNEWSADGRMLTLADDTPLKVRPLPLPMLYQDRLNEGHNGARLGLSKVDRLWREGDLVVMEGTFDMADPDAAELARKVREGYVRFISLDVDMATSQEVCIGPDGQPLPECDPRTSPGEMGLLYTDWRAMGATLLAHPAYPDAIMVALAASAARPRRFAEMTPPAPAAPGEIAGYDPAWGCVRPGGDGWVPADCTEEGAVPASPTGNGPFIPEGQAPAEEMPADDSQPVAEDDVDTATEDLPANPTPEEVEDAETVDEAPNGCVAPDPADEGAWVPAECGAEGAVPANADQTGPAPEVTDAANTVAELAALAEGDPTHAGVAIKALDTGRVLLLQRAIDPEDTASGLWEFPGGAIEEGENPQDAAWREFKEETGVALPDTVSVVDGWRSANGIYQGYIATVPAEGDIRINPDTDNREENPDANDTPEVAAWFDPATIPDMPSLRPEAKDSPWEAIAQAGEETATPADTETAPAPAGTEMTFAVDTGLPWAPRERDWDGAAAADRVEAWATPEGAGTFDPDRMERAFLVVDGPPENKTSYKFGVADVIDGELRLVWNGVVAANAALSGARSEPAISSEQMASANAAVRTLYRQAAEAFDDPGITESESVQAAIDGFPSGGGGDGSSDSDRAADSECVCRDSEDDEWTPCDCDTEGARRRSEVEMGGGYACECYRDSRWVGCSCDSEGARRMAVVPADCEPCRPAAITAAADTFAPGWTPPADWFNAPQATQAMAIQINPDTGRVAGWLADWNSCHVGFPDRCITPPRSATDYSYYNIRPVRTNEGIIYCGLLTMDTGHASLNAGASAALAHYDNTGTQVAVVRVGEDTHGIWAAGAVLPFITEEQRLRLSLASFSGDWRDIRGGTELIAALAVNSPGFPMPQARTGEDNRPYALVAAGAIQRPPARPRTAKATVPVDAGAVAALVIKELDAREERRRRAQAATTNLDRFRTADTTRRVKMARARVIRPVGDFPQPGRLAKEDVDFAKNWIGQQGGLPPYIKRIADHLTARGMETSRAIATAVNVVKKMCSTADTNWPGLQRVNATSQAQACSAVARWEEMKAAAAAG